MEISFIDSGMASPTLKPKKDDDSLSECLDGLQSNNEDHSTKIDAQVTPSHEGGSSGEGAAGLSDDETDHVVSQARSSRHGKRTHLFSFPLY